MSEQTNTQKNVFLTREGDSWYGRNRIVDEKLTYKRQTDPVLKALKDLDTPPHRFLEVGASNGWRLTILKELWPETEFYGLEPSKKAVAESYEGLHMTQGTADDLPYEDGFFDMVTFGFCLYLCDRRDLFKIATEADRVLADRGRMVIYDFHTDSPYRNPYMQEADMYSYKMDYSRLFTWNPAYTTIEKKLQSHPSYRKDFEADTRTALHILRKNLSVGWPDNPDKRNA